MNKTCADCIHDKVCDMWVMDSGLPFVNSDSCEYFECKSQYIKKPCRDDYIEQMIYLRSVKKLSWNNVAFLTGCNSGDACRMAVKRYLKRSK